MRGSGKSTIGTLVADKLKMPFIEIDDLIVAKAGMTIAEIVKRTSWSNFRHLESEVIQDMVGRDNLVMATGGGVVTSKRNIENLKKNKSFLIWLKCSIDIIIHRIGKDNSRPFITSAETFADDLRKVYEGRKDLYAKYADITISSEEDTETVANNIIAKLAERNIL